MIQVLQEGLQPEGPGSKLVTGKGRALDPNLSVTNDLQNKEPTHGKGSFSKKAHGWQGA